MTPEQEIYRANRAKEVIENEAYIEAFASIKQEIQTQWESAPTRDTQGRETLWLMQKLLNKIQATLEATMQSGTLAHKELEHRTNVQKMRNWL
jgi:hypothetical protein